MTNKKELFDRINFWRKQNSETLLDYSTLSEFKHEALETILTFQYTIFIKGEAK
jgi:hypothetical protein